MPLLIPSTGECSTEEGRGWERGWGGGGGGDPKVQVQHVKSLPAA